MSEAAIEEAIATIRAVLEEISGRTIDGPEHLRVREALAALDALTTELKERVPNG